MRLTLRTLLAYLDDTLEPIEIKRIGQKVAESDTAQELIARIKQVTRRRRITTPPATGPGAFDPNMVADYLDNELPPDQVAELEKICLESDVHLAEVASCHQILTLVLGEPALVPPTAKERMYALVHGREAIPFRKATAGRGNASAPTDADADADEMFLLGLPFYRRGSWLRWALPVAGVLLLAVLGVALWQSIRGLQEPAQPTTGAEVTKADNTQSGKNGGNAEKRSPADENKKPVGEELKKPKSEEAKETKNTEAKNKDNTESKNSSGVSKEPDKADDSRTEKTEVKRPPADPAARKAKPGTERAEVGNYYFDSKSLPSVLVQRKEESDGWHRLKPGTRVWTNDRLVSLPGYASEVRLDSGVHLLLRGHVREFSLFAEMDYLQECAVVLHPAKDVDADLTLERGRLFISNHKDKEVLVRLRFNDEVWDLTLQPGAEVVLDLLKRYRGDIDYSRGEEPLATLHLFLLRGNAGLAVEYRQFPDLSAPPGPCYFSWDNKGAGVRGPSKVDQVPPFFNKVLPVDPKNRAAEQMEQALKQLSLRMLAGKEPTLVLKEVLQNEDAAQHLLAIYCLGALDEVKELIAILGDQDPVHYLDRDTAIFSLRRWLGRDATQGPKLYDEKNKTGLLLTSKEYKTQEAQAIYVLLHDFNEEARFNPETYELLATYLLSDKVAVAELARWHLWRLSRSLGVSLPSLEPDKFNAAIPRDAPPRANAAKEVRDKVREGLLPPRDQTIPGTGPKSKTDGKGGSGTETKPPKRQF